jgi:hypothetical protein
VTVLTGAVAIAVRAQQGPRGSVHIMLLSLVLLENALALLIRRHHPLAALLSVLATYVLVDNEATTLLPVLFALFTVATAKSRWVVSVATALTTLVALATPVIHNDTPSLFVHTLLPLLGVGLAAAVAIPIHHRADHTAPVTPS